MTTQELNSVQTITLESFDSASITGTYHALNGTGLLRMLRGSATPITAIEFRAIRFGGDF